MGSEGLTCEQENLEVHGGVGLANQFGSIVSSQESMTPNNSYLSSIAEQDHNTSRKLVNPLIELFPSPILFATENHFPSVLLHNQGLP
jgi:hypothetical protein